MLPACGARCFAWALLSNHVHLVLQSGEVPIGAVLKRVLTGFALRFNLRHDRVGYVLFELARGTRELAKAETPQLRITHEELSRVCDLSRQTVTTILGSMQADGIVALGLRSVRVLDRRRLCQEVEPAGVD